MTEEKIDHTAITVEVAFALPDKQKITLLTLTEAMTVKQAVLKSGLEKLFPGFDFSEAKYGIFGKVVKGDDSVKDGDRIEVYRDLIADPKEVRRRRAAAAKERKDQS